MAPPECICFVSVDEQAQDTGIKSGSELNHIRPDETTKLGSGYRKKNHTCAYTCTDLSESVVPEEVTFQTQVSEQVEEKWLHKI